MKTPGGAAGRFVEVLQEFDRRAASLAERPTIYLVGAGSLMLEGLTDRATVDLDFISDKSGAAFVNVILPDGIHSHKVPSGLVSMPAGWRERSRPFPGFHGEYCDLRIPELADRMADKLARGLATDWQDLETILVSPACPDPAVLHERCAAVLAAPPSTVFEPETFRANYDRLREVAARLGLTLAPL